MSDDRTCPHGKPINHDCGLCDLGQGAISRGPDPRDAEIARLREDVARLREERDRLVPFAAVHGFYGPIEGLDASAPIRTFINGVEVTDG